MLNKSLHITNGSNLTNYLTELDIEGDFITWHEMLCEGPTHPQIASPEFIKSRADFLKKTYNVTLAEYTEKFVTELNKFDDLESYSEIVLWFEYDLFCHINLIAVLQVLHQKENKLPLYLVCSGRLEEEQNLKGLTELSSSQLLNHYDEKIKLNDADLDLAITVWNTYCGIDHNLLKNYITKPSSFKYLGSCLRAHLERFPDSINGLSTLEYNILELIKNNNIKSKHHLLGYALSHQGYYGFGDIQIERLIENLAFFFSEESNQIILNRKGHEALLNHNNFTSEINDNMIFGGVARLDFQFNKKENKLIKTILHAN